MGDQRFVREALRDPDAFARYRRDLEEALALCCQPGGPWPAQVAATIRAALEFAESDPRAARVLTFSSARRRLDARAFTEMVEHFARRLREGAPPTHQPERTSRTVVRQIARQILLQLELRPAEPPTRLAPELIVFALTPYVGFEQAQRWSTAPPDTPNSTAAL